ncbi:aldo/keto reductase [Riemerella columbina]|uniref:aldo/keto reductase n=1 Tax=Riemerella columbina TaxID=103810 RepID=UPI00035EF3B5|nr:aldo/keto reductase [Riemerella columbina]
MKNEPKIALGTWSWGVGAIGGDQVFGNTLSEAQMAEVFDTAVREELNLWDTAFVYGMGSSEKALAEQIRRYPRENLLISTKFTPNAADTNSQTPVADMLAGSLERLGTDYVDYYWIHNTIGFNTWTEQFIPLLESGKIRKIGVSNHSLEQIKTVNETLAKYGWKINAVQNHFSLLYRNSDSDGTLDYCREQGIDFFAYMVLEQGALSGRYTSENPLPEGSMRAERYNPILPQLKTLTDKLAELGKPYNASAAQTVIAYAIAKGTLPLIGATKPSHVSDAKQALNITLTAAQITELEQLADQLGLDTRGGWEGEA